jgi:hypothetical protein
MSTRHSIGLGLVLLAITSGFASAAAPLNDFLRDGRLRDGMAAYAAPKDNAGRFSLAVLQSLDGLQQFSTGFSRLGIDPELARSMPFLRAVVPNQQEASGEVATPEKVAGLFLNLKASLQKANATLSAVSADPFLVEVNVTQARMDLDGDGKVATNEMVLASLGRSLGMRSGGQAGEDIVIHFDSADAVWLKGYTHFLTGLLDILTAYDWQPVWNQSAHVIFRNPKPIPPIAQRIGTEEGDRAMLREVSKIVDLIAALHEMRLELIHKDGLRNARDEFRSMISCSRTCWQRVLAETDDDHEWLPSPAQTGPGGAKVTQQQIDGWKEVLDEMDAVLTGKKLLPHWRMKAGTGINVDKMVNAPPRFDPVLLIQGSALIPYLEEGTVSDQARWRTLTQPFGPGFALFAIWSN